MLTAQDYNDVLLALSDLFTTLVTSSVLFQHTLYTSLPSPRGGGIHSGCMESWPPTPARGVPGRSGWGVHTHMQEELAAL